ncbi:MAG: hypothetical protein IKJ52_06970 [Muribaculaceae bacterium]|nr:hypothetical protein [Muribaculaceae bacterium]
MSELNPKKLQKERVARMESYTKVMANLYDKALLDISKIFSTIDYNPNVPFSFSDYGKFDQVNKIMTTLENDIQKIVDNSIVNEYKSAYADCDTLLAETLGNNIPENVMKAFAPKLTSGIAANMFAKEISKSNITASQRVWNGAVLGQMETAVQEALSEGMPAKRMATLLQKYLVEPDSCFRRFRIKTGVDADGKSSYGRKWKKRTRHSNGKETWSDADPRDFPVGQGIYHSSYKNAFRYARTTTNIAYRTADYQRYQDFAFVIGIEIRLSNNPAHVRDICDELKGKYPKDFKWTGWHPNCMCHQIPILAKKEETDEMVDAILSGDSPENVKVDSRVEEMPKNFVAWLKSNKSRFDLADKNNTLPYFLRDNRKRVNAILEKANVEQWKTIAKTYNIMTHGVAAKTDNELRELFISNPISDFNILQFESDLESIISEYKDVIISKRLTFSKKDISFLFKTKRGIIIERAFLINPKGEKVVHHELFTLPKELQKKGISKKVFSKLYDGYKTAKIDLMDIYANIDQGGYSWARYGFTFWQGKNYLTTMIKSYAKDKRIDCTEAINIINEWYSKNKDTDPFPMNLLTGYGWSKQLLQNTGWSGVLYTNDVTQMAVFKDYLTSK